MNLANFRKEYSTRGLERADMAGDPVAQFAKWFGEAAAGGIGEPNAMSLATVDAAGMPWQRTVLLKSFDAAGFQFFTNYDSRKSRQMAENPRVCLLFPWLAMERQVIVQGRVDKLTAEESEEYFHVRPRESQIGAWVSEQSQPIPSRRFLMEKLDELRARFGDGEIPLPPFWGGYRVTPQTVEFWQGGAARLHDRFFYRRDGAEWTMERLSP